MQSQSQSQSHDTKKAKVGNADVPTTPAGSDASDVNSVYRNLLNGVGHEQVTDHNVDELIRRADADKHPVLAAELREWRSATGKDANIDLDPAHRE